MANSQTHEAPRDTPIFGARFLFFYSLLYLAAWWPVLLYDYWQWDDLGWRDITLAGRELAAFPRPYIGTLYAFFDHFDKSVGIVRGNALVAFVLQYFVWLLAVFGLSQIKNFRRDQLIWIALLAMAAPVNMTRVTLATVQYQIALFVFSVGMAVFLAAVAQRAHWLRFVSALPLLLACQIESFYFATFALFLGVLLIHPQWRAVPEWHGRLNAAAILLLQHAELVLIPIISFATRPAGSSVYADYNAITLGGLIGAAPYALLSTLQTLYDCLAGLALLSQEELNNGAGLLHSFYFQWLAAAAALSFFAVAANRPGADARPAEDWWHAASKPGVAFALMAFLLFPYCAIFRFVAPFDGFADRNLLTIPLAAAMFFVFAIEIIVTERARAWVLGGVLTVMISTSSLGTVAFIRNAQVTDGIMAALRKLPEARESEAFVFDPRGLSLGYNQIFRDYEVNAMLDDAFDDHTRIAVPFDFGGDWHAYLDELRALPSRGAERNALVLGQTDYLDSQWLTFRYSSGGGRGGRDLLLHAVVRRAWMKMTHPMEYQTAVAGLVQVTVGPEGPRLTRNGFGDGH